MPLGMEKDVPLDPTDIRLLRPAAVVARSDCFPHSVQQLGFLWCQGCQRRVHACHDLSLARRPHPMREPITKSRSFSRPMRWEPSSWSGCRRSICQEVWGRGRSAVIAVFAVVLHQPRKGPGSLWRQVYSGGRGGRAQWPHLGRDLRPGTRRPARSGRASGRRP